MTDWNRNLEADYVDFTIEDNNTKLKWDSAVKLAPDADVFGDAMDDWTEIEGTAIISAWPGKGTGNLAETGGVLQINLPGGGAKAIGARRDNVSYLDADIVAYYSKTDYVAGTASNYLWLWRNQNNTVYLNFDHNNNKVNAYKCINGAFTLLGQTAALGAQADMWFRITRVAATQTFTFQYALADPIATPANWVTVAGPVVVDDDTHFDNAHVLYVIVAGYCGVSRARAAEVDFYDQLAGNEERYWPDSPECNVIDSAAGGVEYVVDVGVGKVFEGTGFADTASEPDTSTVKYKMGYGDAADRASATFDGTWRTEAELDTKVANGDFDGHRYLFLKAQFNSDSTDQPTLTDVTISGAAVTVTWTQSGTQAKENTYALKGVGAAATVDDYYYQRLPVVEGEDYYIEAFVYCTAWTDGYGYLKVYDNTGAAQIGISKVEAATGGWRKLAFYFTVPAGCTEIERRVGVHGTGTYYFDCVDSKRLRMQEYP